MFATLIMNMTVTCAQSLAARDDEVSSLAGQLELLRGGQAQQADLETWLFSPA